MKLNLINRKPVTFACVATGSLYGKADIYINRLLLMLENFSPANFTLICITDRPRNVNPKIRQIDCSQWSEFQSDNIHPTFYKIGLFNKAYIHEDEFYYLDLSLIIKSSLAPLIDFSEAQDEDLIIVNEWHYQGYNSSVMRIRNKNLAYIYDDFISGKKYSQKIPGDQDYIHESVKSHHGQCTTFPEKLIISFKRTMRLGLNEWETANDCFNEATIVKFHGNPKMHKLFRPGYAFMKYRLRYWLNGKLRCPIDIGQLKRHWYQASQGT